MPVVQVAGITWSDVQWGTVGEWASGVGTVAAVLVTLRLASRERRAASVERAKRLKVTVVPDWSADSNNPDEYGDLPVQYTGWTVNATAGGAGWFFDVVATFTLPDGTTKTAPPVNVSPQIGVGVGSNSAQIRYDDGGRTNHGIYPTGWTFTFTDADGVQWITEPKGTKRVGLAKVDKVS